MGTLGLELKLGAALTDGTDEGWLLGSFETVPLLVGLNVGMRVGDTDGDNVGDTDGSNVGSSCVIGRRVGWGVGRGVLGRLGPVVGINVGD